MKNPRKPAMLIPAIVLTMSPVLHAAVNITATPEPDAFTAIPANTDWTSQSVAGTAPATAAELDAAVIANTDASLVVDTLLDSATIPPSANGLARQNRGENTEGNVTFLQIRPTGNAYTLLMANLTNATGGPLNSVTISYNYSEGTNPPTEAIKGLRVFWSTTGAPGSWTLIPSLSVPYASPYNAPRSYATNLTLPAPLAADGTLYLLWADQNSPGEDASHHIANFSASASGSFIVPTGGSPVRLPGTDPADPADDRVTFSTTVTAVGTAGAGWSVTAGPNTGTTGTYGQALNLDLPIADFAGNALLVEFADQTTASITGRTGIPYLPYVPSVTATNSPGITFTAPAVGDGNYNAPEEAGAELSWGGGTTQADNLVSNVQTQPAPGPDTVKYFHMTTNATLTTGAVNVSALNGSLLRGSLDLAFYSTSGTVLDNEDSLNFRMEMALDGNFGNTAAGNIVTAVIKDVPLGTATAFSDSIPAANPHRDIGAAFPSDPFTFHPFSTSLLVPTDATNPHARIIAAGTAGISNSEHLLIDNIKFEASSAPSLTASAAGPATWNNQGTDSPDDDTFSVPVNVTGFNLGASTGWTSDTTPATGLYSAANPVTFGPFPGRTPVSATLTDSVNNALTAALALNPPAQAINATVGAITRVPNGAGDADDTVTMVLTMNPTGTGPNFTAGVNFLPTTVSGAGAYPAAGGTKTLTLTNVPNTASTVNVVLTDSSYPGVAATVAVAIPGTEGPYVIGRKKFGDTETDVVTSVAPPAEWIVLPGTPGLAMTTGIADDSVVTSEEINLSAVGAVTFTAKLIAMDNSNGSNFETTDRFKAELLIDGAEVNLISAFDTGNGASSTANDGANGPADGYLNGYSGTAGVDLVTNTTYATVEEEYNANNVRDEFNSQSEPADNALNNTFNLTASIPEGANAVQLRITGAGVTGSEAFVVRDVLFTSGTVDPGVGDTDGDGVSNTDEGIMGTNPNDATDVLRVTGSAADPRILQFPTKAGRFYKLYESTDLATWTPTSLASVAGDGAAKSVDVTQIATGGRRFFRLKVSSTDGPWN